MNAADINQTPIDGYVRFLNRFVKMPSAAADVCAAYALHTHLAALLDIVAYLHIFSPDRGCGKTVLMDALFLLCAEFVRAGDASPAAIARVLARPRTIFVDELDALFRGDKDRAQAITGIANGGYKRSGTYLRCEPPKFESVNHPTFGPKLFAGISRKNLPETIRSRSIPISLERISPDDKIEPLFEKYAVPEGALLRKIGAMWINAKANAILERVDELYRLRLEDSTLRCLWARDFEVWVPLVAVCDVSGGTWPIRIRKCIAELSLGEDEEARTRKERFLCNTHAIFEEMGDIISSADLVTALNKNPYWEWTELNRGKGITMRQMAADLAEYRIRPRTIRQGADTFKGYRREWFASVWKAYGIEQPTSRLHHRPSQSSQPNMEADSDSLEVPSQLIAVTDESLTAGTRQIDNVTIVTDRTPLDEVIRHV